MSKRILIIEDETNIRAMYSDILKESSYEVLEEAEGKEGLDAVMNETWDLLLLDIMLPRLDGIELLKRVKQDSRTKDKPIIILTNLDDNRVRDTCLNLGVREFMVKANVTPSEVVLAVKKYVFIDES
ncbi:response regulator [Patescibacteria group bacterium]